MNKQPWVFLLSLPGCCEQCAVRAALWPVDWCCWCVALGSGGDPAARGDAPSLSAGVPLRGTAHWTDVCAVAWPLVPLLHPNGMVEPALSPLGQTGVQQPRAEAAPGTDPRRAFTHPPLSPALPSAAPVSMPGGWWGAWELCHQPCKELQC